MAVKNDYGEHLLSAIDKMVANVGATDPKMNVMTMEKETQATCEWSARMVTNMTDRRNKLANDLFHNGIRTNSEYMKETNAKVMTEVGIGLRENYTGVRRGPFWTSSIWARQLWSTTLLITTS